MAWSLHRGGRRPSFRTYQYLTSYPGERNLIPGISFASRLPPTQFEKLYSKPLYNIPKEMPNEPSKSNLLTEPEETIRVSNKPEPTLQLGFGASTMTEFDEIEPNDINNDIDDKSAKKVDPKILKAFDHPVFSVQKDIFISGKGKKGSNAINAKVTKKCANNHFLKIVKRKI
jgi:hypothetical protein